MDATRTTPTRQQYEAAWRWIRSYKSGFTMGKHYDLPWLDVTTFTAALVSYDNRCQPYEGWRTPERARSFYSRAFERHPAYFAF